MIGLWKVRYYAMILDFTEHREITIVTTTTITVEERN